MNWIDSSGYWLTRLCFQRGLALIYFMGFLILFNQARPLFGENGIIPATRFLERANFWQAPSLFHLHFSDTALLWSAALGLLLSLFALSGFSEKYGFTVSILTWGLLWILYMSFVNIGQLWYGFGWESLLLETGFLAIFLGPANVKTPIIVIFLLRWLLFRLTFGAGLIKIRYDECWSNLTCMFHHYQTQPIPNPLSRYFHFLPGFVHKAGTAFTLFAELIVPFGFFGPARIAIGAGLLTILLQLMIVLTGNFAWFNYLTIILCIPCLGDSFLRKFIPLESPAELLEPTWQRYTIWGLGGLIGLLSIKPALNLMSSTQAMNESYEPLRLVNSYGAFGAVTKERNEIIFEGTDDAVITPATVWKPYEFKGKPGDPKRASPLMSPYHWRLDWQMWFAAMGPYQYNPWILNVVQKLLQGDTGTLSLLRENPFPVAPPKFIRAQYYNYQFAPLGDPEGRTWDRKYLGPYLPPLSLENLK